MIKIGKSFLITGLILVFISFVLVGFSVDRIVDNLKNNAKYEEKIYEEDYNEDIKNIIIDVDNSKVIIRESENYKISIQYYETKDQKYEIKEYDDTISFKENNEFKLFNFDFGFIFEAKQVIVYVPNGVMSQIKIRTSNGKIIFDNETTLKANNIDLKTDNGSVEISYLVTNSLAIKTSNGKINLNNISAERVDADTSNGSINIENLTSEDIRLDTSNGKISLNLFGNKNEYNYNLKTSNGSVSINGNKYSDSFSEINGKEKDIYAHTSNGSIMLSFNRSE